MPDEKRGLLSSPESSVQRRRKSSRKIAEPAETQDDSVLFKEIWRDLRRKDGDEGVDYFLGETALVNYYFMSEDSEMTSCGGTVSVSVDRRQVATTGEVPEGGLLHGQGTKPPVVSPSSLHVEIQVLSHVTGSPILQTSPFAVIKGVAKMPLVTIGVM
ncbi:hypothetical protein PHMEG_0002935 [Phytophthora megakarya]|uniref:Uncharacterized protein n=1 Tax=Phytophthora megakarya TaxID=4795 RepID=A0A225WZ99_9STRA|nr:hypothetical protein PHMEG_0002935 [Phytophthora megakarya]